MSNSESEENRNGKMDETTKVVLAALVGAGVGAATTLLFTTDKGSEIVNALKEPFKSISDSLDELAESGKEAAESAKQTVVQATKDNQKKGK